MKIIEMIRDYVRHKQLEREEHLHELLMERLGDTQDPKK